MQTPELRSQRRKEVVEAVVLRNEPATLVARVHNITNRTIFSWLARYRSGGWDALKEGKRSGRSKKVSADDMRWIYDAVTMGNPTNYQLEFCLWTLNNLCALLEQERNITLSKSSMSRLLGHLGLTPQRPTYKSYKQDQGKINEYLVRSYPDVVAEAKKCKARIYFIDEASFRSDSHRGTTWGKIAETPVVKDSGGRFNFKLVSAVSARGDMYLTS